jgi:type IV pilus assembly protein PilF
MKRTAWACAAALLLCLNGCVHDPRFKKASPQQTAQTNMQLSIEYMKLGRLAEARNFIELALAEDGQNADIQMTSGLVYERLRETARAEHGYATAYRLGRRDPNIVNAYAGFLCRNSKPQQGEKLFVEAASDPTYRTPEVALVNAGVCVRGTGDLLDAEKYFNRALAVRPDLPEALLQLGNIEFDRGDAAQAAEMVKRYLSVNPPAPEVLWLGMRAARKLGDNVGAAAYARRVQTEFPNSEQALMMRSGVDR